MSDSCYCDYEPAEFYHKETPKARLMHKCSECGHAISPGENYEKVFTKFDGDVSAYKTCCRCVALRDHIKAHVRCFCWYHTNLLDDARETIRYLPVEAEGSGLLFELGRMAVAIKRAPSFNRDRGLASQPDTEKK